MLKPSSFRIFQGRARKFSIHHVFPFPPQVARDEKKPKNLRVFASSKGKGRKFSIHHVFPSPLPPKSRRTNRNLFQGVGFRDSSNEVLRVLKPKGFQLNRFTFFCGVFPWEGVVFPRIQQVFRFIMFEAKGFQIVKPDLQVFGFKHDESVENLLN